MLLRKMIIKLLIVSVLVSEHMVLSTTGPDLSNAQAQSRNHPMTLAPTTKQLPPPMASVSSAPHLNSLGSQQDGVTKDSIVYASNHFAGQPSPTSLGPTIRPSSPQPLGAPHPSQYIPLTLHSGPTPVLMQYLPQGHMAGGVQYLQLIPTRPLLVPITPYITQISQQPQHSQDFSASNSLHLAGINNQPGGPSLTTAPTNRPPNVTPTFRSFSSMNSYPVGSYSSRSPVYQYFRPNPGMEIIESPGDLSLNTNEFIPRPEVQGMSHINHGRP